MSSCKTYQSSTNDQGQVLGVFAKQPWPGRVKSRLAAATSAEWAAKVADAFLRDLVNRLASVQADRFLAYSPPQAADFFAGLVRGRFDLIPQQEGDLGQRLEGFLRGQFQAGARHVVVVGSDSPTLPAAFVEEAFRTLERADVVLGPASDGGYYLLGCAGQIPPLFDNICWGSERVLCETIARLDSSWRLAVLPPWYDVDTLSDWWALKGHVAALRRAGLDPQLPHTEPLLEGAIPCTFRPC